MTDNELLLAISNMMDTKLKSELQPIRDELRMFKDEVRNEFKAVRTELRAEIQAVNRAFHTELQAVKKEMQCAKDDVRNMNQEIRYVKSEVQCIKSCQENITFPKLNKIEAYNMDTYRRYASYTERMEAVFEDVKVLKVVVAEHSEKLRKLA